jgi:hypothetical protein
MAEVDLNKEYNSKKKILLRPNVTSFKEISIGRYTLLYTSLRGLKNFIRISFVRMLYVKLSFSIHLV